MGFSLVIVEPKLLSSTAEFALGKNLPIIEGKNYTYKFRINLNVFLL